MDLTSLVTRITTENTVPALALLTDERVRALNGCLRSELYDRAANPHWGASPNHYTLGLRGGHALMDYVVPNTLPSVVLARPPPRQIWHAGAAATWS